MWHNCDFCIQTQAAKTKPVHNNLCNFNLLLGGYHPEAVGYFSCSGGMGTDLGGNNLSTYLKSSADISTSGYLSSSASFGYVR